MLQVLTEEVFASVRGLDTIRARMCPNTGTRGQHHVTLWGQAIGFRSLPFQRHGCPPSSVGME